jgi:hypothetical protein
MKRFWLVLLSLGLVMAFSVSAFAVDVKVSGEYYAAGLYLNKTSLTDDPNAIPTWFHTPPSPGYPTGQWVRADAAVNQASTAFFYQRLRVGTDFIVSPCLKLVTRFDAMERIWGGARSNPGTPDADSAGTRAENENIAFDIAYIDYTSPIGLFQIGYQKDYEWGTIFDNRTTGPTVGGITYAVPVGPVTVVAQYMKEADGSASAVTTGVTTTDQDYDSYRLGAIYNFNSSNAKGEVGGLLLYNRDAAYKAGSLVLPPVLIQAYKAIPYFKAQIGPVALQGEFEYTFGSAKGETSTSYLNTYLDTTINISAWSAFLDATATFGPVYLGGSFAYLSGDDPNTHDKMEGGTFAGIGINTAGLDWNPCLIMFNNDLNYWGGNIGGWNSSVINGEMSNAWFFQGRVGVKPTSQWDVMLAVAYATADKKPAGYANGSYGTEIDVTATYKITNNLSYMLGAGYLFTGDYFKGSGAVTGGYYGFATPSDMASYPGDTYATTTVQNDYIVMNKLTLNF